jgi:electron transport complex protein RnfC
MNFSFYHSTYNYQVNRHPLENKLTAKSQIRYMSVPKIITIPFTQHTGTPAVPIVTKGDYVKTGQLIAEGKGYISANIHSSVSGKVIKMDTVGDATGFKQDAVFIDVEGDEWIETIDRSTELKTEISLSPEEIINKCRECGIVGMGGATFPSHIKMTIPDGKKCNILIINGVECEPFLTSDHRLMLEKGQEIIAGVKILMKALRVDKAAIGIENNKQDAIEHLINLLRPYPEITVKPLKVKYPQGAEKQLIKALVNREVPPGRLPIDVGAMVHNVATAFAVYEAVQKNKPLFERVVTVTGRSLSNPGNFFVRIGTPVGKLIDNAGGIPGDTGKIVIGGPMMGRAIWNTDLPVTKGTSGVILFNHNESLRPASSPCIRCGKCVSVCALNLEPFLLMILIEKGMYEKADKENITDCIECGSCAWACPAGRPLIEYIRLGKSTVFKLRRKQKVNIQAI